LRSTIWRTGIKLENSSGGGETFWEDTFGFTKARNTADGGGRLEKREIQKGGTGVKPIDSERVGG